MKKNIFLALSFMTACLMLIVSCQDDELAKNRYNDGKFHFKFAFNDKNGQWNEDGTAKRKTRIMTPVELTMPDNGTQPLYLHCIESEEIVTNEALPETTVNTRGQRLTGKVLEEGKIKTLGLYGRVGADYASGEQVLGANGVEIEQATLEEDGDWYLATPDFEYADSENKWTDAKKGYFYGFAPFPGSGEGQAKCITLGKGTDDKPLLNFTMQADEQDNVDVLTACTEDVTHSVMESQGIELTFRHVLSALKFKMKDDAKDLTVTIDGTDYYIQMKAVRIEGIYSKGTLPIATTASGSTTTWTRDDANTIGACEIKTADMRSRDDIATDTYINTDEHCLMVMPQAVPDDARLVLVCDITENADGSGTKKLANVSYSASLKGKTWLPGNSYTYTFSKYKEILQSKFESSDFAQSTTSTHPVTGGEDDFHITSIVTKISGTGLSSTESMPWHPEYSTDGGTTWKKGLPGNFMIVDAASGKGISDVSNIAGGTNVEYQLKSGKRTDGSTSVHEMAARNYVAGGGDGYVDLSTNTISKGSITSRNRSTANCYIIDGCGKFKLPLAYGNAILNGSTNSKSYTEQVEPKTNATYEVFFNYKDEKISHPYILDDVGVSIDDVTASVVWMDETNLIDITSLKILKDDKGYIAFEVDPEAVKPGNVVIAVKDGSGTIMWSWHIWLTTLPMQISDAVSLEVTKNSTNYKFGMARAHLGRRVAEDDINNTGTKSYTFRAVQNETGKVIAQRNIQQSGGTTSIPTSSIYYQFGRKDPVPAAYPNPETSFNSQSDAIRMEDLINEMGYNYTRGANGVLRKMAWAIQHPDEFINPGHAYTWMIPHGKETPANDAERGQNTWRYGTALWNISYALDVPAVKNQIKTIYDPSPYGYMVATRIAKYWANTITREQSAPSSSVAFIKENQIYVFDYTDDIKFPLCGARNHTSANMESINGHGYAWTTCAIYNATDASNNQVHAFGPIYSKSKQNVKNNTSATFNQGRSLPVRCMRDEVDVP